MPPVRVKIYGLIALTKRTYLTCVAVAGAGLVVLLAVWALTTPEPTPAEKAGQAPLTPLYVWRQYAPWIVAAGALLGAIEAYVVLKRFRRAEAGPPPAPAPDAPPKGS